MKYAIHVGQGWRDNWRGIIFRRTYPELAEVVQRSHLLFRRFYPSARFVESGRDGMHWRFPQGETLKFRYALRRSDIEGYLGHQFTFIGWEELTTWADDSIYEPMLSCCRSACEGIPLHVVSNTNPWGPGHGWVRARFVDPAPARTTLKFKYASPIDGQPITLSRVRIHGRMREKRLEDVVARTPWWVTALVVAAMLFATIITQGSNDAFIYFQF